MKEKITILGAGAFGTSIAMLLADNNYQVYLWCYESDLAQETEKNRENKKYFPGFHLNKNIKITHDLQAACNGSKWIFEAIPSKFLRSILIESKKILTSEQIIVVLSKGIEQESLFLPTQIIEEIFDKKIKTAVMAGPNFATEIASKCFSAASVSAQENEIVKQLSIILSNSYFKTESSDDLIGVQVGGAIKNVIAIAIGMASNASLCQNTIAYLITEGVREISQVCLCLGGKEKTAYGLSGLGDLVLTSTGALSRNLKAGKLLAQGKNLTELGTIFATLPEGINTAISIHEIMKKCNLDLPLCKSVYQVIFEEKSTLNILHNS